MLTIKAAEFKAKCLKLMDKVQQDKEEVVITKHGRPVAKLVPIRDADPRSAFGFLRGTAILRDDLIESNHEQWEAEGR